MRVENRCVLCWDIDGTLLTTDKAGTLAWEKAVWQSAGLRVDLMSLQTSGMTDLEIAVKFLEHVGLKATPERVRALVTAYEDSLLDCLPLKNGRVLDGVVEILEHIQTNGSNLCTLLLTGNTRRGAKIKLEYYGLSAYFLKRPENQPTAYCLGAFADDGPDRITIAKKAFQICCQEFNHASAEQIFVIGDTPNDVRCGQAIGARTIAVASGVYDQQALEQTGAWRVLPSLSPKEDFFKAIGL